MKRETEIQIAFVYNEYPKILHITRTGSIDCFEPKKLLKAFRYQLKLLKVHFELRFGLFKKTTALMNPWVTNMNGKNY